MTNNNHFQTKPISPFQDLIDTYEDEETAIDEVIDTFVRLIISACMSPDQDDDRRQVLLSAEVIYKNLSTYRRQISHA